MFRWQFHEIRKDMSEIIIKWSTYKSVHKILRNRKSESIKHVFQQKKIYIFPNWQNVLSSFGIQIITVRSLGWKWQQEDGSRKGFMFPIVLRQCYFIQFNLNRYTWDFYISNDALCFIMHIKMMLLKDNLSVIGPLVAFPAGVFSSSVPFV